MVNKNEIIANERNPQITSEEFKRVFSELEIWDLIEVSGFLDARGVRYFNFLVSDIILTYGSMEKKYRTEWDDYGIYTLRRVG